MSLYFQTYCKFMKCYGSSNSIIVFFHFSAHMNDAYFSENNAMKEKWTWFQILQEVL